MELFNHGSFGVVGSQLLCLTALLAGIATAGMKVDYFKPPSADVLPSVCIAGSAVYDALYMACFATLACCAVQGSCVTLVMWMMASKKTLEELPPSTAKCCRGVLFTGLLFNLLSFGSLICILDCFVFARVCTFACMGGWSKALLIFGDTVIALVGLAIFTAGARITLRYN